jgi:lipoate-protein ligase A
MTLNFIDTGLRSGSFNMNFDVDLSERLLRGEIPPTLRLYGWKPWSVSLGYHQSVDDIDSKKCTAYGFDIVRRPTGGRAILHANELTYSIVMPAEDKGINEIYSEISRALVAGLQSICPEISYESSQPNFRSLYKRQESIPCFSSSARYEVQINGRKLVGSAQRRYTLNNREVVLQHGSILLGTEHQLLTELLCVPNDEIRLHIAEDFRVKTIDLSTATGRTVSYGEAAEAVLFGFRQEYDISTVSQVKA